ncbi:MAG: energy-coupling factor transporter transmembrane protein EcfT [Sulfolobales archaeon]|nr:energy-coupling factor transporter transmembrane protein EcfT [Sulfolobales archaeon]MCX8198532.1 energy-coupling factor transporter transmembrane protein EcfT [Sulfolobales archaeon]MDW8169605.1 energy-coupling factor transporter transmembrane component T [Desulfurococcaceae archaeon]
MNLPRTIEEFLDKSIKSLSFFEHMDIKADPAIAIAASFISIVLVSTSSSFMFIILNTAFSMMIILMSGGDLWKSAGLIKPALVFAVILGSPYIVQSIIGDLTGLVSFSILIAKITAAMLRLVSLMSVIGWSGVIYGLIELRVPKPLVEPVYFFSKFAPLMTRDLSKLLMARESRNIGKSKLSDLFNVVGEVIVRGIERGNKLSKALEARGLSERPLIRHVAKVNYKATLMLILILLLETCFYISLGVRKWF